MFSLEERLEKDVSDRDRERVRDRVRERERDLDFSTFLTGMVGTFSVAALIVSVATGIVKT